MGWTMECPDQTEKLVREIGWRELGLSWNSAAHILAACTQIRIRQHVTARGSHGFELTRSKTWTKDCSRHTGDSTTDATRTDSWGCQVGMQERGWAGVMDFLDHGIIGQNVGAYQGDCSTSCWIMGSWAVTVHYLLENRLLRSWRLWGRKCPTMSWKIDIMGVPCSSHTWL